MSREIKFRVWHLTEKRWLDPYLEEDPMINLFGEVLLFERPPIDAWTNMEYALKKLVIQQFTGLLDKNNKEIYEGDVLKNDINTVFQVVWNEDGFFTCQADTNNNWIFCKKGIENSKIIGNIFENSKLLKNK